MRGRLSRDTGLVAAYVQSEHFSKKRNAKMRIYVKKLEYLAVYGRASMGVPVGLSR